jgi:hypothetical protein
MKYLVEQQKIPTNIANKVVNEVAGGRMLLLNRCAASLHQGLSYEGSFSRFFFGL